VRTRRRAWPVGGAATSEDIVDGVAGADDQLDRCRQADRHGGRLLMVQEGGYSRTYSALCLHASLEGVLGTGKLLDDPVAFLPDQPERAEEAIEAVRAAHAPYWTVLR